MNDVAVIGLDLVKSVFKCTVLMQLARLWCVNG